MRPTSSRGAVRGCGQAGGHLLGPLSPRPRLCWPRRALSSVGATARGRRGKRAGPQASTLPMPSLSKGPGVLQQRRGARASQDPDTPASIWGGVRSGGLHETRSSEGPLSLADQGLPPSLPTPTGGTPTLSQAAPSLPPRPPPQWAPCQPCGRAVK